MLNEQISGVLSRIATLQQEIYDRETELANLLGLSRWPDENLPEQMKKARKPSHTRRLTKAQKEGSKAELKKLVADMLKDGGKITQLAVTANSRTLGIATNAQQVALILSHMARKGLIDELEERNEMGEREYRKRIGL